MQAGQNERRCGCKRWPMQLESTLNSAAIRDGTRASAGVLAGQPKAIAVLQAGENRLRQRDMANQGRMHIVVKKLFVEDPVPALGFQNGRPVHKHDASLVATGDRTISVFQARAASHRAEPS